LEEISEISNNTTKKTSEYVQENNELQEDNNDLQKKLVQVIAKQREEEDAAQKESRMEAQSRMTRTSGYSWGRGKKGKKDDGGGGGNRWRGRLRMLRKLGRRIRNPRRTFQAIKRLTKQKLKKIPGVKQVNNFMKNKKPLQGLRNMFGGNKAKNAAKVADTASDASRLGSRFSGLGSRIGGKFNGALGGLRGLARSPLGRFGGRAMIGLGTLAGIDATRTRFANMNDPEYQKMVQAKRDRGEILTSEEQYSNMFGVATGAASAIPALGLPVIAGEMLGNSSMLQQRGIDMQEERKNRLNNVLGEIGVSSDKDRYRSSGWDGTGENPVQILQGRDNRNIFQKMGDGYNNFISGTEKMASGGVMAGEAGPESIFDLESVMGRKVTDKTSTVENSALAAAPFILGISRKVLETSGVGTETIKSFYEQEVAPLERMFGVSNFSIRSDVGKGVDQAQKASTGSVGGFDLGGLLGGIGSMLGSLFGGPAQAATPGGGAMGVTLSGTAADRVGNDPEFLQEVTRLSQKYQIKEGDLLGLMASESGLDPKSDNGKGFVGLIQFSADSAAAVGTTQAALKSMTRAQQMKYVEKYFDYWKLPKGASAGQLYATVFAPAYASKDDSTVLYSSPSEAYRGNAPLDSNGDGTITVGEMGGRIEKKKKEFGITDSGIRQQPPAQNATQQQQLPAAPPPAAANNGHQHNTNPGPINPMPWSFSAQSSVAPPTVMPLPVIKEKSGGAQVIPFSIGGTQGYTTRSQGFEGRETVKTFDTRGRQYPSFQALHNARLQMR